jgi:hypothetical protein
MLDPRQRKIYLSQLRPPEGYLLDKAICTTYSLDLISLLMAPLSMALFEAQNQKEMMADPLAVLEALRRTTDRIAVFCQQGRIALPANNTRLVSLLEKVVVEVKASDESGVFHPKVWALKFTCEDEPTIYRFLCLSRNLTFDKSWDTILTLEGEHKNRKRAFRKNRPLVDFIQSLPGLAAGPVGDHVQSLTDEIAGEIATVDFEAPQDIDEFYFRPSGIPGYWDKPNWGDPSRLMIVSPFLSESKVNLLAEMGSDNVLVSRPESLDEISDEVMEAVEENCDIYIMNQDAEMPEPDEQSLDDQPDVELTQFTGLHAKLFIVEENLDVSVSTGSANFSNSALDARNVEFMVELFGRRRHIGIEKFLGNEETHSFRNMLKLYNRDPDLKVDRSIEHELEMILEKARDAISSANIEAAVIPSEGELFDLVVKCSQSTGDKLGDISGSFYPISLKASSGKSIVDLLDGETIEFRSITPIALTSFFAFEISAEVEDKTASIAFVMNVPVQNMPEDRDNRLLQYLISDQKSFIRYLLLILMEGEASLLASDFLNKSNEQEGEDDSPHSIFGFQLLEELIRAYSRYPEKIDRIAKLVADLERTPEGKALFPPGFEDVWQAFREARGLGEVSK